MCQKHLKLSHSAAASSAATSSSSKTLLTLRHVSSTETKRSTRPFIKTLLVLGIITMWVSTNKLLQYLHNLSEWHKPFALGIVLKCTWALSLLVWPLLRQHYDRRERRVEEASASARAELGLGADAIDPCGDAQPLELCWRVVRVCCILMVLVQVPPRSTSL